MNFKGQFSLLAIAITSTLLTGCGESSSSSAGEDFNNQPIVDTSFNEQALIANITDNVITPTFTSFSEQAQSQLTTVTDYCQQEIALADLTTNDDAVAAAKEAAQSDWTQAISTWQQAELMQIGPLLENDSLLKSNIYAWPIDNSCAVDFDVMFFRGGTVNGQPYDITKRTAARKGMAALEYLLFTETLNDSCDVGSPDGWNNLTDSEKKIARCNFAVEVANDITSNAATLVSRWQEHAQALKQAGQTGSEFATDHEAVNTISDAMFYIDSSTKDGKLATPVGLFTNSCGSQACPEEVESKFANQSINHIINNLLGFDRLLQGEDGVGFTDYLNDVGAEDTANTMVADLQNAIANAQAYEKSLAQTLTDNPDQVSATHADVKKVTDKLKADFITSLSLELPKTSAGDND